MARTKKIEGKATQNERNAVKEAADILGISMSEFVRVASLERAAEVSTKHYNEVAK